MQLETRRRKRRKKEKIKCLELSRLLFLRNSSVRRRAFVYQEAGLLLDRLSIVHYWVSWKAPALISRHLLEQKKGATNRCFRFNPSVGRERKSRRQSQSSHPADTFCFSTWQGHIFFNLCCAHHHDSGSRSGQGNDLGNLRKTSMAHSSKYIKIWFAPNRLERSRNESGTSACKTSSIPKVQSTKTKSVDPTCECPSGSCLIFKHHDRGFHFSWKELCRQQAPAPCGILLTSPSKKSSLRLTFPFLEENVFRLILYYTHHDDSGSLKSSTTAPRIEVPP